MSADGTLSVPPAFVEVSSVDDSCDESDKEPDDHSGDSDESDDPDESSHSDNLDKSTDDGSVADPCHDDHSDPEPSRVWTSDPVDVTVTFDGTWSRRSFIANYGVVVVISWDTGRVLDSYVLNKQCTKCARKSGKYPEDSLEYQQWYARHKDSCSINHTGSSPAMEMEGAKVLWNRSVKRLNLRYKNVVSDGDSKTVVALNNHMIKVCGL